MIKVLQQTSKMRLTTAVLLVSAFLLVFSGSFLFRKGDIFLQASPVVRVNAKSLHGGGSRLLISPTCEKYVFGQYAVTPTLHGQTMTSRSTYGRLGNRLLWISQMISTSEIHCCDVLLPEDVLEGWSPASSFFAYNQSSCKRQDGMLGGTNTSGSLSCSEVSAEQLFQEWKSQQTNFSQCPKRLLEQYFEINDTHVLGKQCPQQPFAVLHIRSGDITGGAYDEFSGVYEPNAEHTGVHSRYWPYPTSYYVAVIKNVRTRAPVMKIYVFCEDMSNPSCDFFHKLSEVDVGIVLRTGEPLLRDLHYLLCAQEVAVSHGSFKSVFELSKLKVLHHFEHQLTSQNCTQHDDCELTREKSARKCTFSYWIDDAKERDTFRKNMKVWRNSGYQRYLTNSHLSVKSCSTETPVSLLNLEMLSGEKSSEKW
jgi:hypothetical protein